MNMAPAQACVFAERLRDPGGVLAGTYRVFLTRELPRLPRISRLAMPTIRRGGCRRHLVHRSIKQLDVRAKLIAPTDETVRIR
jgi:hypothetical protein